MRSYRLSRARVVVVLAAAMGASLALGCSSSAATSGDGFGSASGKAQVSGTVGSESITATSAIAVTFTQTGDDDDDGDAKNADAGADDPHGLSIAISDKGSTCSAVHDANATILVVNLAGAIAPGRYPIAVGGAFLAAGKASANFSRNDATCSSGPFPLASGGSVTVTSASSSAVVGSFDVTFTSGHLTGSFDASICGTDPTVNADGGLVCND